MNRVCSRNRGYSPALCLGAPWPEDDSENSEMGKCVCVFLFLDAAGKGSGTWPQMAFSKRLKHSLSHHQH